MGLYKLAEAIDMTYSRVTVVITCYNLGRYLPEAVLSVHNQTFREWELIIVDDGSDDPETVEILANLERKGERLLRLNNCGVAKARNTAIHCSKAPYICCLDGDDVLDPKFLERTVALMEKDESRQIAIVTTWVQSFGNESVLYMTGSTSDPSRLLTDNLFHISSLYRRENWENSGGYGEALPGYQDWDLWLSFVEKGYTWETVEEPLFKYRVRSGSMVTNSDRIRPQLVGLLIERHRGFFERNLISAVVHREEKIQFLQEELKTFRLSEERKQKIGESFTKLDAPILPGEEIYVFGAGQMAAEIFNALSQLKPRIVGVFDNDKTKHGSCFYNVNIEEPRLQEKRIVIASMWGKEISEQLALMGYGQEKIILVGS
jgi:glycosyltransferase involved in cell wall biosynthesis